jgi:hypothetical protein
VDLERERQGRPVEEGGPEPRPLALDEAGPQVDGAQEEEVVGVPEERREVEPPGAQPVQQGEEDPLAGGDDPLERAVQDEIPGHVEDEDEQGRGPVVLPQEERQAHEDARDPPRRLPSGRHGVAVGDPRPLLREEPAPGEEVQLVAPHLAPRHHPQGDGEADGEENPDLAGCRGGRGRSLGGGDHGGGAKDTTPAPARPPRAPARRTGPACGSPPGG